jgi:hypothetical protein
MILWGLGGGFFEAFCNGRDLLSEHPVDGGAADQVVLRQLSQALPLLAVAEDGGPIEDQGLSPEVPALTSRANFNLIYMNATAICSPRN